MKLYNKTLFTLFVAFFAGCGNNHVGESSANANIVNIKDNAFIYLPNSPYKDVLIDCINPTIKKANSCSLNTLPFIAKDNKTVTKQTIMQRVVVSDAWMAKRFEKLLDALEDKNIKKLFSAVTAVVIHRDIRPSFYTPVTAAIYLDPRYLWLTPEEASTITTQEDFRSNFGNDLQFVSGSVNTLDSASISSFKALDSNLSRTLDEITMPFAALLYHELAHANDFVPASLIASIDKTQSVFKSIEVLSDSRISKQLDAQHSLTSIKLASLGKVLYRGHTASDEEKEMTGFLVGELFDEDTASDIYAYSTIYEDTATLFTDTMMKIHFNVDNNVLFLHADTHDLEWGIRNPIAKASVRPRALFVSNRLSPIAGGWDTKFDTLVGTFSYLHTEEQNAKLYKSLQNNLDDISHFKDLPL